MNIIEKKLKEFDDRFGYSIPDEDGDYSMSETVGRYAGCDDCAENRELRAEHKDFLRTAMLEAMEEVLEEAKLSIDVEYQAWHELEEKWMVDTDEIERRQKQKHQEILSKYKQ